MRSPSRTATAATGRVRDVVGAASDAAAAESVAALESASDPSAFLQLEAEARRTRAATRANGRGGVMTVSVGGPALSTTFVVVGRRRVAASGTGQQKMGKAVGRHHYENVSILVTAFGITVKAQRTQA